MSENNLGVLSAKVALDTVDFNRNIASMKRELKVAKSETELASKGVVGFGQSTRKGAAELQGLTKQINIQKQALDEYDRRHKEAIKTDGEGSRAAQLAAQNYNKTAGELQALQERHKQLGNEITYQNSPLKASADEWKNVGAKATSAGDSMMSAGKKWTVAGAGIVATAAVGAKAAIEYESSFSNVTKTVDGTAEELDNLSDGIRKMATEIPVAATDLAELAATAGQLGIETPNIESFTRTIADLGVATNLAGEEGASQLAKFANITKMSQTDFDRLGSSIVDLGNHFSTTEADIMNMAMRLAGAGTQVGMSQADILGLSTALSSVGVEAEAGGSAFSKVMIQMQLAVEKGTGAFTEVEQMAQKAGMTVGQFGEVVLKGGKESKVLAESLGTTSKSLSTMYKEADKSKTSLEDFATVAGMSADEFSNKFKTDAVGAIEAFIQGLAKANDEGDSAILMLDNMDIKEVRLRDSLLRSANASGMFGDAVKLSNAAWEENTALTTEAETKYGTTASKIQIAKNKIHDLSISFGNELIPVIADLLENSEPIIEWLKNMIEGFSDASPATKKFVMTLGAIGVVGGPVVTTVGGITKGFGKFTTFVGKSKDAVIKLQAGLTTLGSTAELTTTGASGLASVIGGAGTASVAGTMLAATAVVVGTGLALYGLHEALDATKRSGLTWGTDVTKEQDKVLEKTRELSVDSVANIDLYQAGVTEAAGEVKKAYEGMAESVKKSLEKQREEQNKTIEELPPALKKNAEQQQKINQEADEKFVAGVESRAKRALEIMDNAYNNGRKLTESENAELLRLTEGLTKDQVEALNFGAKEQEAIMLRMSTNVADMTPKALEKRANAMKEAFDKEKSTYKEQQKQLKEIYAENPKMLEQEMKKLASSHKDTSDRIVANYMEAKLAAGTSYEDMTHYLRGMGYTYEEANVLVEKFSKSVEDMGDKVARGTSEADNAWNSMVLDEKTGEVRDNLTEFLVNTAKSKEGWDSLLLVAKEATITSNARTEIAIAVGEAGKWNELSVDEKYLVANNNKAVVDMYDAINTLGIWNEATPIIQELGADNHVAIMAILESKETLQAWNEMSPDLKTILVNDQDKSKIMESTRLMREFDSLPNSLKNININADTGGAEVARQAIDSVNDKNVMIRVEYQGSYTGQAAIPNAKGTQFHPGGMALVNDQPGSLYREAIIEGNNMFIPEGRNVLYPLQKGAKVIPAGMTKAMFPNYKDGVGLDGTMFRNISDALIPFQYPRQMKEQQQPQIVINNDNDTGVFVRAIEDMRNMVAELANRPVLIQVGGKEIASAAWPELEQIMVKEVSREKMKRGKRQPLK